MFTPQSRLFFYKTLSANKPVTVSLDVHDKSTYMYAVNIETGELLMDQRITGHYRNTLKHLKQLCVNSSKILILYEAGPHGFAPYRLFEKHGYSSKVIAPVSIVRDSSKQKSDRDDAINNLSLYAGGFLSFVCIPEKSMEDARDCLRYRTKTVWEITREKQQIHSLIKRQGIEYTQTKSFWTKTHYAWLRTVEVSDCTRILLNAHLQNISTLEQQSHDIEKSLMVYFQSNPQCERLLQSYQKIRGVGLIYAMTLVLEAGDLRRFSHPNKIMKFVGLLPGRKQSGEKDPNMRITKNGNKFLRTVLVGIAKKYTDHRLLYSKKQMEQMSEIERSFFIKMQNRLTHKYRSLRAKAKHGNKARVAVARELCGFLWEYVTTVVDKTNKDYIKVA